MKIRKGTCTSVRLQTRALLSVSGYPEFKDLPGGRQVYKINPANP